MERSILRLNTSLLSEKHAHVSNNLRKSNEEKGYRSWIVPDAMVIFKENNLGLS